MADRGVHEPRSTNHDHALPPATDDRQPATVNRQINYRGQFHKVIADEIAWFEERAARDRQARAELKVPSIEAALETDDKTRLSLINQERLDRLFERKWRLLARYRENGCR